MSTKDAASRVLCGVIRRSGSVGSRVAARQGKHLFIVAHERDSAVSDFLRGLQALGLGDDLVDGVDIDQLSFVESDRGLGAKDLEYRLVDARLRNLAASNGIQDAIVGGIEVGRDEENIVAGLHRFDRGAGRGCRRHLRERAS